MRLGELLYEAIPREYADLEIQGITSRIADIRDGYAFVFVQGVFYDRTHILYDAIQKKPSIIIGDGECPVIYPYVRVENARRVLSEMLYRFYFSHFSPPPIIGITGTNGKSSILEILNHLFREKHKIGLIGTQRIEINGIPSQNAEYTMTTPDPEVLYPTLYEMHRAGCDYIFMEVSSHALALEKVAPLSFEIALFTGLSEEHLDFHKSVEEYIRAKEKIFSQCKLALLNTDDKVGQEYAKKIKVPVLSLGMYSGNIRIISPISNFMRNTIFTYCYEGEKLLIKTPLLALHNIYNCALAFSVYMTLHGDVSYGLSRLATLPQIKGRMECVSHAPSVFLDYAHTPQSMECVLGYFKHNKSSEQRLFVVFGAGGDRDREKRASMASVAEKYADLSIVTTDNPRNESQYRIFKDIKRGFHTKRYRFITNRQEAISYAYSLCTTNDILILLGKGHEPYIIKKGEKIPYSELYSLFLARTRGGRYEN